MKKIFVFLAFTLFLIIPWANGLAKKPGELLLFKADNPRIRFFGRIDFSDKQKPRIWAPGVYFEVRFKGSQCEALINDETAGNNHNYLEIVVDDSKPYRIELSGKTNVIKVPEGLSDGGHTLLICKDTESNSGFIELIGFRCEKLLPPPENPTRKIEYFGDSITSGTGMDISVIPCHKGQWADQHNAYMSYGAVTSRNLNAQWQLTAQAGIGLVHSCCNMNIVMPQVYDKVCFRGDSVAWDFKSYQPDVVTICLGQNDGKQDSALYCKAYVGFIGQLRQQYPKATIICLTSPMADSSLTAVLKHYITSITTYVNAQGDKNVYQYFFSRAYNNGCDTHPDLDEHKLIAAELTACIKQIKGW